MKKLFLPAFIIQAFLFIGLLTVFSWLFGLLGQIFSFIVIHISATLSLICFVLAIIYIFCCIFKKAKYPSWIMSIILLILAAINTYFYVAVLFYIWFS